MVVFFLVDDLVGYFNCFILEICLINDFSSVVSEEYLVIIDIYSDLREISGGENDFDLNFVNGDSSFLRDYVVMSYGIYSVRIDRL